MRLTGTDAIDHAEREGLRVAKHADPTEDARERLTLEEAREVAREDPSLVYIDTPLTTAELRRLAREAETECRWADAASYLEDAIRRYPDPTRPGSLAERDIALMQKRLDAARATAAQEG